MKRCFLTIAFLIMAGVQASAVTVEIEGKGTQVPVCGGFPNIPCGAKEYCDYPLGAACGVGDMFGTCRPRPEACNAQNLPVCGCDGENYSNACQAAAHGTSVAHPGKCGSDR